MPINFAEGALATFFAKVESAYDTVPTWAATDGVGLLDLKLDPDKEFHQSKERVGTASAQSLIAGMRMAKWSAVAPVKPNAAGTPPDITDLLKSVFGETIVGGTSVTYALSDGVPSSIALMRHIPNALQEVATGAWTEQVDIEIKGNDEPKITFSGGYATHGFAYGCDVGTGGASTGAGSAPYATAHKGNLAKNARVSIDGLTNSGSGYLITSVDNTTTPPTFSFTPNLSGNVVAGGIIAPVAPTPTLAGTILGGVNAGLTIDGTALGFIEMKLQIKTGYHGRTKEASADRATGVIRSSRVVEGEIQFYFLDRESAMIAGRAWDGVTRSIALRIGANTAAQRMKVNVPKAFGKVSPINIPDAEEATFSFKFQALQNSAAADEANIVFD
jgi:hypothetical protein